MGFMSQMVGESIGNFIDQYLDYDEKNNVNYLRSFMRIGVLMDVQKPFMKSKIKKPGGEFKEFCYKYEYLGPFCYFCGILGHTEDHCRTLLFMQQDDGKCGLGPKIQVEACPNDGASGSRYLWDTGDPKPWQFSSEKKTTNVDNKMQ